MATQDLAAMIATLSDAERAAVAEFVQFLKEGKKPSNPQQDGEKPSSPFLSAVDEFVEQHPELLRRLAQ